MEGEIITERLTNHIADGNKRIAMVDSLTIDLWHPIEPVTTIRYQYDNHLGSACLELDEQAQIISYEEYHPFGTTSYRSGRSLTETSLKRYKYVGKERDEETGLYYYGARYYAAWLCRFVSVDPIQFDYPELTPYQYASNRPVTMIDIDGLEAAQPYITEPVSTYYSNAYIETGKRFEAAMAKKIENQKAADEFNKKYGFVQQNLKNIPAKPVQPGFQVARKVFSNTSTAGSAIQLTHQSFNNNWVSGSGGNYFKTFNDPTLKLSGKKMLNSNGIYEMRGNFGKNGKFVSTTEDLSGSLKYVKGFALKANITSSVFEGLNYYKETGNLKNSALLSFGNFVINYNPAISVIYNFEQMVTGTEQFQREMMNYYESQMNKYRNLDGDKYDESKRLYTDYVNKLGIKFEKVETTIGPTQH
jgi:RHS repeat-associated protein